MSVDKEKKKEQLLIKNFEFIGKAPTVYARKMSKFKINKYREKINAAPVLNKEDFRAIEHPDKIEKLRKQEKDLQLQQQNIILGGTSKFVPFIVEPFSSCMIELYRGERIRHNMLKILIVLLLTAAVTLSIMFLPVFSVPFVEFAATLFGKTATLTAGMVGIGFAFKIAEIILDTMQPVPDHVLRFWKKKTGLDHNTVNIMQQYLINSEKVSQLPAIKNLINVIKTEEMRYPTPESLQKLTIFFSKQLLKLQKEKEKLIKLPASLDQKNQLEQVKLDIIAVTFILEKLSTVASIPSEAHRIIEERLPNPEDPGAHQLRKDRRRAPLIAEEVAHAIPKSVPPVSFSKNTPFIPATSEKHRRRGIRRRYRSPKD